MPSPAASAKRYFLLGLLGLPFLHLSILLSNLHVFPSLAHSRLSRRHGAGLPFSTLDKALVALYGPPPPPSRTVPADRELALWVLASLASVVLCSLALAAWLAWFREHGSDKMLVRTVPAAETSGW
jgi:hypothetical protein